MWDKEGTILIDGEPLLIWNNNPFRRITNTSVRLTMITLSDVQTWIDETYNEYISVYDYTDYIRVTNGSAGMYADIKVTNDRIRLKGKRYSETFDTECDPNKDALLDALGKTLGL
jgi:hypothetical protein